MDLKAMIRDIPDFPKPGILFRDVSPLLQDPKALTFVAHEFGQQFGEEKLREIQYFAGIESRGFIFAMLMAAHFKKGFIPIRKAGKLPPPVVGRSYQLEYGQATIEMNKGKGKLIILDDVLATGGTLQAAVDLAQEAGYQVVDLGVLINLSFLNQMKFAGASIKSLIQY